MAANRWSGQLASVALRCGDAGATARFYEKVLGLEPQDLDDGSVRLSWGGRQPVLELSSGVAGLDRYAIEVPEARELDGLIEAIRSAGIATRDVPASGAGPEGIELSDPEGRVLHLHGRVDRSWEHAADPGRRPIRLQHITFATADLSALEEFYVDALGFRVSDRMGQAFTWLRCGVEHHTIAAVATEGSPGLDHYSFDLCGWPDFKTWCDRLSALDVPVTWGPGRHGPGNNLFLMFDDPDGVHVELSAEMEQYWDDRATYVPRNWEPDPRTVNLWGPTPAWRTPVTS